MENKSDHTPDGIQIPSGKITSDQKKRVSDFCLSLSNSDAVEVMNLVAYDGLVYVHLDRGTHNYEHSLNRPQAARLLGTKLEILLVFEDWFDREPVICSESPVSCRITDFFNTLTPVEKVELINNVAYTHKPQISIEEEAGDFQPYPYCFHPHHPAAIVNGSIEITFLHFKTADEEEGILGSVTSDVYGFHLIEGKMPSRPKEIGSN